MSQSGNPLFIAIPVHWLLPKLCSGGGPTNELSGEAELLNIIWKGKPDP